MVHRLLASVLAVGIAAAPAFAQAPREVAPLAPAPAPKNPSTARALSLGFTVSGAAMVLLGYAGHSGVSEGIGIGLLYLGPSTGHWYAGELGGIGLGLRSLALFALGAVVVMASEDCEEATCHAAEIDGLLVASGTAWLGSTIYDIVTAPRAARSWNRAHGIAVGPTIVRSVGHNVPGVALGFTF